MPAAVDNAKWAPQVSSTETKRLLSRFFELADLNDPHAGRALATDVFTSDGKFVSSAGTHEGKSEIAKCREKAWDTVVMRRHTVESVLAGDKDGKDLILSGNVVYRTTEGVTFNMQFSGLAKIVTVPEIGQRLSLWHAYGGQASRVD